MNSFIKLVLVGIFASVNFVRVEAAPVPQPKNPKPVPAVDTKIVLMVGSVRGRAFVYNEGITVDIRNSRTNETVRKSKDKSDDDSDSSGTYTFLVTWSIPAAIGDTLYLDVFSSEGDGQGSCTIEVGGQLDRDSGVVKPINYCSVNPRPIPMSVRPQIPGRLPSP